MLLEILTCRDFLQVLDALVRADAHAAAARVVLRGVLSPDEEHALHPAVTLLMQVFSVMYSPPWLEPFSR